MAAVMRLALPALLALAIWAGPAHAISMTCLPATLPVAPPAGASSYFTNVVSGADRMTLRVWRLGCLDSEEAVLLMRATPTAGKPVLKSNDFRIAQSGLDIDVILHTPTKLWPPTTLSTPVTVIIGHHAPGSSIFDRARAFSVQFRGRVDDVPTVFPLDVADSGAPSLPSLLVAQTNCNPCHSGDMVGYHIYVANPGPAVRVEVKGGIRLPDGLILGLVSRQLTLPSGVSAISFIPDQPLPSPLPAADVIVEAALLEPELGVTIARHNTVLHLLP